MTYTHELRDAAEELEVAVAALWSIARERALRDPIQPMRVWTEDPELVAAVERERAAHEAVADVLRRWT